MASSARNGGPVALRVESSEAELGVECSEKGEEKPPAIPGRRCGEAGRRAWGADLDPAWLGEGRWGKDGVAARVREAVGRG